MLILKPTQPVFYSMIQLTPSALTRGTQNRRALCMAHASAKVPKALWNYVHTTLSCQGSNSEPLLHPRTAELVG